MLERIVETIEETTSCSGLNRKDALFIIKKVIGQANIPEKSRRIQRTTSKNSNLKGLIGEQINTLQSMKKMIMKEIMIQIVRMI